MREKTLTLSVVIPTYNEETYIGKCLDAIAAQTEMPDEVIIVDNNSIDKTVEIAEKYDFVTVLKEKEQGVRFARNKGFNAAKSNLIGRIDADTRLSSDWCAQVRTFFSNNPSITAATGSNVYYDLPLAKKDRNLVLDRMLRRLVYGIGGMPLLYGSNMALRVEAWNRIADEVCMDGLLYEDYDVSIHLFEHGFQIAYDKHMVARLSARRLDDRPAEFIKNMNLHTKTFALHGQKNRIASISRLGYLSVYPALKVMLRLYDEDKGRISLKKAARKRSARPDASHY
jgi:glycosyltransferase involved in cell wall biosynthesis